MKEIPLSGKKKISTNKIFLILDQGLFKPVDATTFFKKVSGHMGFISYERLIKPGESIYELARLAKNRPLEGPDGRYFLNEKIVALELYDDGIRFYINSTSSKEPK